MFTIPRDDLGAEVPPGAAAPRRVVSLVPSLTEAIASVDRDLLVGCTQWCTHPGDLDVGRVRGTKNPDTRRIVELAPDLVVANQEENRELDVQRLRAAGVPVWVTVTRDVPGALEAMRRLIVEGLRRPVPTWLVDATRRWAGPVPAARARVAVPVWRDPWMVVGRDTFTGDLLRRAGLVNVFADADGRYPHTDVAAVEAAAPDLVLLPSEPYEFTADDGPEAFTIPTRLVDGRLLTWYGPSLLEAGAMLDAVR